MFINDPYIWFIWYVTFRTVRFPGCTTSLSFPSVSSNCPVPHKSFTHVPRNLSTSSLFRPPFWCSTTCLYNSSRNPRGHVIPLTRTSIQLFSISHFLFSSLPSTLTLSFYVIPVSSLPPPVFYLWYLSYWTFFLPLGSTQVYQNRPVSLPISPSTDSTSISLQVTLTSVSSPLSSLLRPVYHFLSSFRISTWGKTHFYSNFQTSKHS